MTFYPELETHFSHKDGSELIPYERGILVGMKRKRATFEEISKETGVSRRTIQKVIKRARTDHGYQGRSLVGGRGRPKKLSKDKENAVRDMACKHPEYRHEQLVNAVAPEKQLSTRTIRHCLKKAGIRKWMAKKRSMLTEFDACGWLEFA
ncbi:unnamed protein product [Tuber aestivum]|uniref:Transposase Tc1-like domain-containing protein n=1 Tax=Tuber aestivum TaxID=59557 RepID=A0A292PMX2_9PEZI|nr:unnamed protein product [Tuber aestivum]